MPQTPSNADERHTVGVVHVIVCSRTSSPSAPANVVLVDVTRMLNVSERVALNAGECDLVNLVRLLWLLSA
jgi:hypothetical protein